MSAGAANQHLNTTAASPHNAHTMGPRIQQGGMVQLRSVAQGKPPGNTTYAAHSNPNIGKLHNIIEKAFAATYTDKEN